MIIVHQWQIVGDRQVRCGDRHCIDIDDAIDHLKAHNVTERVGSTFYNPGKFAYTVDCGDTAKEAELYTKFFNPSK